MKYIHKIGIEIEGGWETMNPPKSEIKIDRSVIFPNPTEILTGEVVSSPFSNLGSLKKWVETNYPPFVNPSCGLHVHLSFKSNSFYSLLMEESFKSFFITEMTTWGKNASIKNDQFWERLAGNNKYCAISNWNPDLQAEQTQKKDLRRCIWNFCYNLRTTAECRMLPCFKEKNTSWAAINQIIHLVEKFIENSKINDEFLALEEVVDTEEVIILD